MSGNRYAKTTSVSVDRTRSEIESVLTRFGASAFGYATEGYSAMIRFHIPKRDTGAISVAVQMRLVLPDPDSKEFTSTPTGKPRARDASLKAWEQACRASWRALLLVIRAKLEAVEVGISTLEREFMADVLLPSGKTIGEEVSEQKHLLDSAGSLRLLPGGGDS